MSDAITYFMAQTQNRLAEIERQISFLVGEMAKTDPDIRRRFERDKIERIVEQRPRLAKLYAAALGDEAEDAQ